MCVLCVHAGEASARMASATATAAAHAGEAAAPRAVLAASTSAPERLLQRLMSPAMISRVGRGAMVALPAIGAIFVAHLAHQV